MNAWDKRFANLLRAHREQLGMKQGELAKLLHVTQQTVSKMELGRTGVSFGTAMQTATVLGFVEELVR